MRLCSGNASCSGQTWPPIRLSRYRRFFGLRSLLAVSSVAYGRIEFVLRVFVGPSVLRTICSLPVALHVALPGRSYFQLSGGKHRQGGTLTLRCTFAPKRTSADFSPQQRKKGMRAVEILGAAGVRELLRTKVRAPPRLARRH